MYTIAGFPEGPNLLEPVTVLEGADVVARSAERV